jgi:hypothetical protein
MLNNKLATVQKSSFVFSMISVTRDTELGKWNLETRKVMTISTNVYKLFFTSQQ